MKPLFLLLLISLAAQSLASDLLGDYIDCICRIQASAVVFEDVVQQIQDQKKPDLPDATIDKLVTTLTGAKESFELSQHRFNEYSSAPDSIERATAAALNRHLVNMIDWSNQIINLHEKFRRKLLPRNEFIQKAAQNFGSIVNDQINLVRLGQTIVANIQANHQVIENQRGLIDQLDRGFGSRIKADNPPRLSSLAYGAARLRKFLLDYIP